MHQKRHLIFQPLRNPVPQAARQGFQVALVFGNETFGLNIDEVQRCNRLLTISGNPAYFSLNLAQAVQVVCYEIFSQTGTSMSQLQQTYTPATQSLTRGMVDHLEQIIEQTGFANRRNQERMMRRLHSLFDRASPSREDIDLLRGLWNRISQRLKD